MITIDIRFNDQEVQLLKEMIGKRLQSYRHNEFQYTNTASQIVQITTEGDVDHYLYSMTERLDYFGTCEDVAVWSISREKLPFVDKLHFISNPVGENIQGISLVQENQCVFTGQKQLYDVWLTRGLIIDLPGHQIAFEKDVWFSEEIIVHKGYSLLDQFVPANQFGKNWDDSIRTECERTIITL